MHFKSINLFESWIGKIIFTIISPTKISTNKTNTLRMNYGGHQKFPMSLIKSSTIYLILLKHQQKI